MQQNPSTVNPTAISSDISVVIVNHKAGEDLYRCLDSVLDCASNLSIEIFVVDNNSADGTNKTITNRYPRVFLIRNKENVGFSKANNQAIRRSQGGYVLLLNPDTVLYPGVFEELIEFMDAHQKAGAIGCKLLNLDGSIQYSIRNFPRLLNQLSECFFLHKVLPRVAVLSEVIRKPKWYEQTRSVDWLSGAALMIRRETLDQVGLLDEEYFLYSEEKDWCWRARQAGWDICYFPGAQIMHRHGESGSDPHLFGYLIESKLKFLRKHYSTVAEWTLRCLLRTGLLVRKGLWSIRSLTDCGAGPAGNKVRLYQAGLRQFSRSEKGLPLPTRAREA